MNNYDEEDERVTLKTESVCANEKLIVDCFTKQLEKEYMGNITVQALLAMCSKAHFAPNRTDLKKKQSKLIASFESVDAMYEFSNFHSIQDVVNQMSKSFQQKIIEANKLKLRKLAKDSYYSLEDVNKKQLEFITIMQDALKDFQISVSSYKHNCEIKTSVDARSLVDKTFYDLKKYVFGMIDTGDDDKSKIDTYCSWLQNKLVVDINKMVQKHVNDLKTKISNKAREVEELSTIKSLSSNIGGISLKFDFDSAFSKMDVSLKDLGSFAMDAGGWALTGSIFGPIGAAIGGVLGAIFHILRKCLFGDGGKGEAKAKIQNLIDEGRIKAISNVNTQLFLFKKELDSNIEIMQYNIKAEYEKINNLSEIVDNARRQIFSFSQKIKNMQYGEI